MFDGLSYGLPFVASQLAFFEEFAFRGLGIAVKRKAEAFSKALLDLDTSYDKYGDPVWARHGNGFLCVKCNSRKKYYKIRNRPLPF